MVKLNLAVQDYLRANAEVAPTYALAKWHAVSGGADMLLAYSDAKRVMIEKIVAEARALLVPDPRAAPKSPKRRFLHLNSGCTPPHSGNALVTFPVVLACVRSLGAEERC